MDRGRGNGARPTSSTSPVTEQTGPEVETPTIRIPMRLKRRGGR